MCLLHPDGGQGRLGRWTLNNTGHSKLILTAPLSVETRSLWKAKPGLRFVSTALFDLALQNHVLSIRTVMESFA